MKIQSLRRCLPLAFIVVFLILTKLMLKRFEKALVQPTFGSVRAINEDKVAKVKQRNAHEVKKLQGIYSDMIETRKRERAEERETMRANREQHGHGIAHEDFDPENHERFARDQMERYKTRSRGHMAHKAGRGRGRSNTNPSTEDEDDGFTDDRAIYYMSQIRKKASLVANHLEKTAHHFSEEEVHDINQQIVDYLALEKKVAAFVQKTADDFNKARDIEDKDKRLKYLDKVKADRDARLPDEKAARETARDHYLAIRARLEPHLYPRQEL